MPDAIPPFAPPNTDDFIEPHRSNQLIGYLGDVRDWHGYVKFLSLAALRETSQDVPLEKLFVEPHLAAQHLLPDAFDGTPPPTQSLSAALAEHPRLVLLGDPGSGKSTVVNWICTALGRGVDGPLTKYFGGPLVPFPFILRELGLGADFAAINDAGAKWQALLTMFLHRPVAESLLIERQTHGHNIAGSLIVKLLENGQALLLLDGLDEIGSLEVRRALREAVQEGMRRYPRCRWVLTSRIVGYEEMEFDLLQVAVGEKSKGKVATFKVTLQTPDDADPSLIGKDLFAALSRTGKMAVRGVHLPTAERLYLAPFNDAQIDQFTRLWWAHHESNPHLAGTKPAQFTTALRASHGARSLARLPHLLTMIALIYRVIAELPDGRAKLYSLIADAYLGTLDKDRGLEHLRPIPHTVEEMSRWLAAIGWHLQRRRGESGGQADLLIGKEELVNELTKVIIPKPPAQPDQRALNARETAELFLEYAGRRSGLLLPRAEGRYAFLHLSFQEYFAAQFLRERVSDPDWLEIDDNQTFGTSLDDLKRYTQAIVWRETTVFLFESLGLVSSILPQRLIQRLFEWPKRPADWPDLDLPTDGPITDENQWDSWARESGTEDRVLFLAQLSVNPHVVFDPVARQELWRRCWRWEYFHLLSVPQLGSFLISASDSVAGVLLSRRYFAQQALGFGIEVLNQLPELHHLCLSYCSAIVDLNAFSNAIHLTSCAISACPDLFDASGLGNLHGLKLLWLEDCPRLENFNFIARLSGLTKLHLASLEHLETLEFLLNLSGLEILRLTRCPRIHDLQPVSHAVALTAIDLTGCIALTDLSPLLALPKLASVILAGCTGLDAERLATFTKARPEVKVVPPEVRTGLPEFQY